MAEQKTVTVKDAFGNDVEVPVGADGENPVSPNNPPTKALPEADREGEFTAPEDTNEVAKEAAEAQSHTDYDPTDAVESLPPTSEAPEGAQDAKAETEGDDANQQTEESTETKPKESDSKQAWVDYAVSQGMDADEANAYTKNDLIEHYKEA